ncbi:MAG TPA: FG-GAP-like repeat-containing protein [Gaiellaceae bacterium]|nr:FG-GAP-like repeat-containing protein [Gaiellaceae bacterium]
MAVAVAAAAVAAIALISGAAAFNGSVNKVSTSAPGGPAYDFAAHAIKTAPFDQVERANQAGDMNGDGRPDLVIAGESQLVWYENPADSTARNNGDWPGHLISNGVFGIASLVQLRDLDGDGRLDIVVGKTQSGSRGMYWYRNLASGFEKRTILPANNCHHLAFGDFNKDGREDMACAGGSDPSVFWIERPTNILTATKWSAWVFDNRSSWGARVADFDKDGNLDFLTGRAWYRNPGLTSGSTATQKVAWTRFPYTSQTNPATRDGWDPQYFNDLTESAVLDVNGDTKLDVVAALFSGSPEGKVSVFLSPADPKSPNWTEVPLDAGPLFSVHTGVNADYDKSGRPQIAIGEMAWGGFSFGHNPGTTDIAIYRLEGANPADPAAWTKSIIATDDIGTHAAAAIDLNGDGRLDLISGEENSGNGNPVQNGRPRWWENKTVPGPPINVGKPVLSGNFRVNETVSATDGGWQGSNAFARQWQSCDTNGANCSPIAGASSNTLLIQPAQQGKTLRFEVTATNDNGPTTVSSDPSSVVQPAYTSAPQNLTLPTLTGTFRSGSAVSGTDGTWQDAASLARQWQSCDGDGNGCTPISGATNNSYTLTSAEVGHTLKLRVTATNSIGSTIANSAASAVVEGPVNRAPDPSFESAKPTQFYKTGGSGTFKVVSGIAHTGVHSWNVKGTGTGIKKIYSKYQYITGQEGVTYSATGWVKTTAMGSASEAHFEIWFYDKTGTLIAGHTPAGVLTGVKDWTMLSSTGVAPAKTAFVAVALELEKGTGTLYYDDVTLSGPAAAPSPVTNFGAAGGDGVVNLTWTKPSGAFDAINIVRKQGTSDPADLSDGTLVYSGTGASLADTTVTNGLEYHYAAWVDSAGTLSTRATASATPNVPPVTNFHAVGGSNKVTLSWVNPSGAFDSVDIYKKVGSDPAAPGDGVLAFSNGGTSFIDTTVTNGLDYHYAAFVKHGTAYSLPARANATPNLPPVTNLTAGVADSRVDLNWTLPAEALDSVKVVRKQGADPADPNDGTLICSCPGTSTTTSDNGATNGVEYHYGVWSEKGGALSTPVYVTATPTAAITYTSTPTGAYDKTAAGWTVGAVFHVTVDTVLSHIGKKFQAGSTASNSLGLWDELNPATPMFTATLTPAAPEVDVPLVLLQANKHYVLGIKQATGTPWSGARLLTGLPPFLVIDDSAFLQSSTFGYPTGRDNQPGFSNEDWKMTLTPGGSTGGGTVNPVTNFVATPGDTQVSLTWQNPAGTFDAVKIMRKAGSDPTGPDDATATQIYSGTGTSKIDTGLNNNVEYHYGAWVTRDTQLSSAARANATPVQGPVPPVTGLSATAGDRTIDLSWTNPGGTWDKIQIYRKTGSAPTGPTDGTLIYEGTDQALHQTNLTNRTLYYYSVVVVRGVDLSSPAVASATPKVPAVTNLLATAGDTQVGLSWTPPSPYDSVIVRRSTSAYPTSVTDGTGIFDAVGTGTTDNGLTNNTQVFYSVFVRHGTAGQASSYSDAVQATATPVPSPVLPVTNLVGNGAINGDVTLNWANPTSGAQWTSIIVRRTQGAAADPATPSDGAAVCSCAATDTSVVDTGRTTGITYHYGVWVERNGLYSPATRVDVVPPVPPVQNLNASPANTKVTLSWSDPAGPYDSLQIRRKDGVDPANPNDGTLIVPDGNSYEDVGLLNAHTYHYAVWAKHNNVFSVAARVNATPGTTGTAVTNLAALASDQRIDLSWTNPGDSFTAIKVVRKQGSAPANVNDGNLIYQGTDQQKADIGLTNGASYYYGVWVDRGGSLSPVAIASGSPALPPVTDLQGLAGDKVVDLSWDNPPVSFTSIRVVRKLGSDPTGPADGTQVFNGLSEQFTDNGPLTNNLDYHYAVWVVRSGSPDSEAARVTATPVDAPVPPVTNLVATPGSLHIDLSWTLPGSGFDTVKVVRKQGSAPTDPTDGTTIFSGVGTSVSDTGLQSGLVYHYAVWTIRSGNLFSSPVRTSASPPVPPVTGLQGSPGNGQVSLSWTIPSEPYDTIKVVRKAGSDPANPSDGTLVYNDTGSAALDIGLTNGVPYHYGVWVVRVGVLSAPVRITVTPATTANAGVTNLQAQPGDQRLDLSWTNPSDSYDSVKVTYKTGSDPTSPSDGTPACVCVGGESTLAITGLNNGTAYHVAVWVDRGGVLSAPTVITATPAPPAVDPVTNLQAAAGDGEVHLTWTNPLSPFDVIKVTRKAGADPANENDGTIVFSGVGTVADDFGLVDGTEYHYGVWVHKGNGVSAATRVNATPQVTADPNAPVSYAAAPRTYNNSTFNKTMGVVFQVSSSKVLAKLGRVYSPSSTGGNQSIAIWDQANTTTPLYQSTISPSATTVSPNLSLQPGVTYVLGIQEVSGTPWSAGRTLTGVPSFLTIVDTAFSNNNTGFVYPGQRNSLPGQSNEDWLMRFTAPAAPVTNFDATAGNGSVHLSWTNPAVFDSVEIWRKAGADPTAPGDGTKVCGPCPGTSADDNGLSNGTQYNYAAWVTTSGVLSPPARDNATPDVNNGPVTYNSTPLGSFNKTTGTKTQGVIFHVTSTRTLTQFGKVYQAGSPTVNTKIGIWDQANPTTSLFEATINNTSPNASPNVVLLPGHTYVFGAQEKAGVPWSDSHGPLTGLPSFLFIDSAATSATTGFLMPDAVPSTAGMTNGDWTMTFAP